MIGGISDSGTVFSNNEEYTIASNTWATKTPRPIAACAHEQVVWRDSLIYCLGGYTGTGGSTVVFVYNPFTDAWATGTALPQVFDMGAATIIGDNIYIVGGVQRSTNTCWTNVYRGAINPGTPTTITWTSRAALPVPNAINACAALGGKVYELGGFENLSTKTDALREYDSAINTWAMLTPYVMPIALGHYLVARPSESALYVIAGEAGGTNDYYYKNEPPFSGAETGKITFGKGVSKPVLAQSRPNPATSLTRIGFALPRAGDVSLKLYNVGGQEVKVLLHDHLSAGAHEILLPVREFPVGVYFYGLSFEGRTLTQKMVVVRE